MRFKKYFFQSEETGADTTNNGVAAPAIAQPKDGDDTVKRTIAAIRAERDVAIKKAADAEARWKEREDKDEEAKAKQSGDFETWKERIRVETTAQIEAERKDKMDKISATESDSLSLKAEWKMEKIISAFSKVLRPEFVEKFARIPDYQELVEVVKNDKGRYSIVIVESADDRTPRFKSDGKKTVPFTIDDLALLVANEVPTAASPINKASGDNISHGNGQGHSRNNFNRTATAQDLVADGLGFKS